MASPSRTIFHALILFIATVGISPIPVATAAEVTTSFPRANGDQKAKNVLRPNNETPKCKKARTAYERTRRRTGATPLEINADRRAVLAACKISP